MRVHQISKEKLTISKVAGILQTKIELSDEVKHLVVKCRNYLDEKIKTHSEPIYGINTGFGSLCNTSVSNDDLGTLQKNLVMSHACGIGDEVPQNIVKLMLLLKIQGLSYGHSGVQLVTIERLVDFYNNDILPVVYQQGSLGASGDLAPLAHLALALIGMGEVYYKGQKRNSEDVLKEL
ncbi:MAG: aromatic amino acid lyase, partial [Flavobacteriales bacterium]|nr:aromatic amino acid lyase [Flavobacteriales bacterium]